MATLISDNSDLHEDSEEEKILIQYIKELWHELNKRLEHLPKFQNKHKGVHNKHLNEFESKLKIKIPKEMRAVVRVHDGQKHIGYGLGYRLPSTDLLPVEQWKPYENNEYGFAELLFQCLDDKNIVSVRDSLLEDVQEHMKVYMDMKAQCKDNENEIDLSKNEIYRSLPCELLVIGQGMDDYAEQYLLSIRSGRIYLAIHNIPEWILIGTFADWIQRGLKNIIDQQSNIKEEHEAAEVI